MLYLIPELPILNIAKNWFYLYIFEVFRWLNNSIVVLAHDIVRILPQDFTLTVAVHIFKLLISTSEVMLTN